jgi:hypothetical protein
MLPVAMRYITPEGDVCVVYERDIDRIHHEIVIALPTFAHLMEAAGFTRVDNLQPERLLEDER